MVRRIWRRMPSGSRSSSRISGGDGSATASMLTTKWSPLPGCNGRAQRSQNRGLASSDTAFLSGRAASRAAPRVRLGSPDLQSGDDGVGDLGRRGLAAAVHGLDLAVAQDTLDRVKHPAGRLGLAGAVEQVNGGQKQRQRVGPAGANGFAGAAVERLVDFDAV